VSPPAAPPVQAAPSADAGPSAEDRISELLNRYKEALEAKDLNALKRSWPSLGGSAENAIRQEFQHASQISVRIDDAHISVSGNSGKATFLRHYSVVTVEGQRLQSTARATMDVRRAGAVWVIDSLKFTQQ
jgi:ketosteroid isomerase-like protein